MVEIHEKEITALIEKIAADAVLIDNLLTILASK